MERLDELSRFNNAHTHTFCLGQDRYYTILIMVSAQRPPVIRHKPATGAACFEKSRIDVEYERILREVG